MNASKKADPIFWSKWRKSGAVSDRAPGYAMDEDGKSTCPCSHWARRIDSNFRKVYAGKARLRHAELCDGFGGIKP